MRGEVTVSMAASPAQVWALVSDVTRIGEFSPETFEARWLPPADGPQVDARFRGHVKRNRVGPIYWTTCRVLTCEPDREFSFAVIMRGVPVNTWGYRITPTAGGCDVTEFFDLAPVAVLKLYWALLGRWRGRTNHDDMRTTLERMKAVVESENAER